MLHIRDVLAPNLVRIRIQIQISDTYQWIFNLDLDPHLDLSPSPDLDPALFFGSFQDTSEKQVFPTFLGLFFTLGTFTYIIL
jgi:hypothetical protein